MLYRLTPRDDVFWVASVSLKACPGEGRYNTAALSAIGLEPGAKYRDYKSNYPVDYRREDHNFDWLGSNT